jgi:hypothetical protein
VRSADRNHDAIRGWGDARENGGVYRACNAAAAGQRDHYLDAAGGPQQTGAGEHDHSVRREHYYFSRVRDGGGYRAHHFDGLAKRNFGQLVQLERQRYCGGNATFGQICVTGSSPCQPFSGGTATAVDYVAPGSIPSPNPFLITVSSTSNPSLSTSAIITIINHVVVSVLPNSVSLAPLGTQSFTATVLGTANQNVIWQFAGTGCGTAGSCGTVDARETIWPCRSTEPRRHAACGHQPIRIDAIWEREHHDLHAIEYFDAASGQRVRTRGWKTAKSGRTRCLQ